MKGNADGEQKTREPQGKLSCILAKGPWSSIFNLFHALVFVFLQAVITVYKELDLYFTDYLKGILSVKIIINTQRGQPSNLPRGGL